MGNFFPRWTNWVPLKIAVCLGFIVVGVALGASYYFTPKYTRVGYEPTQPVPFSHKQHVGELGLDCRYCHSYVEVSGHSNVPTNQTCFNCHGPDKMQVKKESEKLAKVREANESGDPINWIKVHKAPDYVYFNHSVHVNRGVSCVSCHGQINEMEVVKHDQPHSMGWCLDCHREPQNALRPLDQITNLTWKADSMKREDFYAKHVKLKDEDAIRALLELDEKKPLPTDKGTTALDFANKEFGPDLSQKEIGSLLKAQWKVHAPEDCTACHR
jgi:formate-dependent nitrite reductase cytochrome c552 subunit